MELRKEEFPIALQAYEVRGDHEDFVAEQVVASQTEADNFMSLYSGRLIKTRDVRPVETKYRAGYTTGYKRRSAVSGWLIFLLVLVVLVVAGLATGWLQTIVGRIK